MGSCQKIICIQNALSNPVGLLLAIILIGHLLLVIMTTFILKVMQSTIVLVTNMIIMIMFLISSIMTINMEMITLIKASILIWTRMRCKPSETICIRQQLSRGIILRRLMEKRRKKETSLAPPLLLCSLSWPSDLTLKPFAFVYYR